MSLTFTVEYKRTVRVRKYETMTVGLREEFYKDETLYQDAFNTVKTQVEFWIDEALRGLTEE